MDKWEKVADIRVTGGHLVLVGNNFEYNLVQMNRMLAQAAKENYPLVVGLKDGKGEPDSFVRVATGIGDGDYPVEALIGKTRINGEYWGKRVKALRIVFIPPEVENKDRAEENPL